MAENSGITKVEKSSQQEIPAEETNKHFNNIASEMNDTRTFGAEGQMPHQQLYNQASFNQFQTPAADPTQQTTSQNSLLSPQYNYPPNYFISYDPSQYVPSPEYPVDWNAYNAAQYYPDNYFYYKYPTSGYSANEAGDSDAKVLEQSFNQLNVNQYPEVSSNQIDFSMLYQNSKQFMPANNTNNNWEAKRTPDQPRWTSSRYWSSAKSDASDPQQMHLSSQYNPREFNQNVDGAKYFVIKSYSEEDIFRSIKYNVWCSTEFGNKRLDSAFKSKSDNSTIYLFFSVNGSGHFCGVATMTSAVDFEHSPKVWTQNKWKGQFSVKWVYVKDVPNNQLRHIRLENNENKPVTNSRDTQEVPADKGRQVLLILHQYKHNTSIFDDLNQYEQRLQVDQ